MPLFPFGSDLYLTQSTRLFYAHEKLESSAKSFPFQCANSSLSNAESPLEILGLITSVYLQFPKNDKDLGENSHLNARILCA